MNSFRIPVEISLGLQKTRIEADFRRGAGKIGKKGIFCEQKSDVVKT